MYAPLAERSAWVLRAMTGATRGFGLACLWLVALGCGDGGAAPACEGDAGCDMDWGDLGPVDAQAGTIGGGTMGNGADGGGTTGGNTGSSLYTLCGGAMACFGTARCMAPPIPGGGRTFCAVRCQVSADCLLPARATRVECVQGSGLAGTCLYACQSSVDCGGGECRRVSAVLSVCAP